jgi:hypothetical protein
MANSAIVRRLTESDLAEARLLPGQVVEVLPGVGASDGGTAVLSAQGQDIVPAWISALVWVAPA